MNYWLMKIEPSVLSVDALAALPGGTVDWYGVRNYAARNFLRAMKRGDQAFYYHSSCPEPGVAGIVEVVKEAYPDPTQFDSAHEYFDPKSPRDNPRWSTVDVKLVKKLSLIPLARMREAPALEGMVLLQRGSRLSVTPVSPEHWKAVLAL